MKKTLIICSLLALIGFGCKKVVINNPAYGIGTIVFYKPANIRGPAVIDFIYYVGGNKYANNYSNKDHGWSVPASGGYNSGDKYMVQYDVNNANTCRFLFDYPVNSPADSANYVNQFKSHPPSCCLVYAFRGLLKFSY